MKDRDGNEWVLVPIKATDEMTSAAYQVAKLSARAAINHAIAAAPQFVPAEVDDAMCERVGEIFAAKRHGNTYHERGHAMIAAVRSELGPKLGLVELREPVDTDCERMWMRYDHDAPMFDSPAIDGRAMFNVVAKWLKGEL